MHPDPRELLAGRSAFARDPQPTPGGHGPPHRLAGRRRAARRRTGVVVGLAVLVASVVGCGRSTVADGGEAAGTPDATAAPVSRRGGLLRSCVEAETAGYHPYLDRWSTAGLTIAGAVYDPLTAYGSDGRVRPYLAESMASSSDHRTWTISLRPGVTFHDGTALRSDAIVLHLERLRTSFLTSTLFDELESVEAVDDLTARVQLRSAWATFPAVFTGQAGMVPSPSGEPGDLSDHPVGTGPFVWSGRQEGIETQVRRNDRYWRPNLPYLDRITFLPASDTTGCEHSLRDGLADVGHLSAPAQRAVLADAPGVVMDDDLGEREKLFVMLNTKEGVTADPRVRRALAYATDPGELADATGVPRDLVIEGVFDRTSPWAADVASPSRDVARATELVDEVEAETGQPVEVTLTGIGDPTNLARSQNLQVQWERAGFVVELQTVDQNQLILNAIGGAYEAVLWRQFGSPDPDGDFQWWITPPEGKVPLNFSRFDDPAKDEALRAARATDDVATRQDAYTVFQERLADGVPYVWLLAVQWTIARVAGVHDARNVTLPDGSEAAPMVNGVMRFTETWMDPASRGAQEPVR